jgi:hypothetical protein
MPGDGRCKIPTDIEDFVKNEICLSIYGSFSTPAGTFLKPQQDKEIAYIRKAIVLYCIISLSKVR